MNNVKWTTGVLVGCAMLLCAQAVQAQDWPQWRGPNRDNKVVGFTAPKEWPKELKKGWSVKVGMGEAAKLTMGDASPVLVGDKLYIFTREGGDEVIRCLKASDGTEVWKDKYKTTEPRNPAAGVHAGPRSSPAVADGKVVTFGAAGIVSCLDAASGKLLWRKDKEDYPGFFVSSSPIIVDGQCIVYTGNDRAGAMVAYDLAKGDEKWKKAGDGAAYGSPVLMTVDKTKMVVTLTKSSLIGINAADGKQLWKAGFSSRYNSTTPVVDGQTVICSTEGAGSVAFKIEKKDDGFEAKQLWKQTIASGKYNTPLLKDGLLYGLAASGGGGGGRGGSTTLFCLKADSGEKAWTDDTKRGECGGILDAGSVLFLFSTNMELVVMKPSDKKFEEVAKYKIAGSATWAFPIIAGNRVFVKDQTSVTMWTIE